MNGNLAMLFNEYKSAGSEMRSFEASLKNIEMCINAIVDAKDETDRYFL